MEDYVDFDFLRYIVSSNIRTTILFSLNEGSKSLNDLKRDVDLDSRNMLRVIRHLIDQDLISKTDKNYSLTNSGRLIALNLMNFLDLSSQFMCFYHFVIG